MIYKRKKKVNRGSWLTVRCSSLTQQLCIEELLSLSCFLVVVVSIKFLSIRWSSIKFFKDLLKLIFQLLKTLHRLLVVKSFTFYYWWCRCVCLRVWCQMEGTQCLGPLLTPTKGHGTWSIGAFLDQRFVIFTALAWMNSCPAMFAVVLKTKLNKMLERKLHKDTGYKSQWGFH